MYKIDELISKCDSDFFDKRFDIAVKIIQVNLSIWDIVQQHYPDYDHADEIAWNDDLEKLVNDEQIEGDCAYKLLMETYGGDINNPQIIIDRDASNKEIYTETIAAFVEMLYTKYKLAFHPDDNFDQYVNQHGEDTFTKKDAIALQAQWNVLRDAFDTEEEMYAAIEPVWQKQFLPMKKAVKAIAHKIEKTDDDNVTFEYAITIPTDDFLKEIHRIIGVVNDNKLFWAVPDLDSMKKIDCTYWLNFNENDALLAYLNEQCEIATQNNFSINLSAEFVDQIQSYREKIKTETQINVYAEGFVLELVTDDGYYQTDEIEIKFAYDNLTNQLKGNPQNN